MNQRDIGINELARMAMRKTRYLPLIASPDPSLGLIPTMLKNAIHARTPQRTSPSTQGHHGEDEDVFWTA